MLFSLFILAMMGWGIWNIWGAVDHQIEIEAEKQGMDILLEIRQCEKSWFANRCDDARNVAPALERMRDEELDMRKQFFSGPEAESGTSAEEPYIGPRYNPKAAELIDASTEEDEVICTFCKAYCYLSRYLCRKTGKVLCLLHAGSFECCDAVDFERYSGQNGEHVLQWRMSDDVLHTTVRKVVDKAHIPETWAGKVDSELENNPKPSLRHLRTLLTEGEKIQCSGR